MAVTRIRGRVHQGRDAFTTRRRSSALLAGLPGVTDLLVFCARLEQRHGGGRSAVRRAARQRRELLAAQAAGSPAELKDRTFGVDRVFWPSKKFADRT